MKKIALVLVSIFIATGCSSPNLTSSEKFLRDFSIECQDEFDFEEYYYRKNVPWASHFTPEDSAKTHYTSIRFSKGQKEELFSVRITQFKNSDLAEEMHGIRMSSISMPSPERKNYMGFDNIMVFPKLRMIHGQKGIFNLTISGKRSDVEKTISIFNRLYEGIEN